MEKNPLKPTAFGIAFSITGSLAYLIIRLLATYTGFGIKAYQAFAGVIISRFTKPVWIIPELIQMAIVCFVGGYLIAYLYNRFS